MTKLDLGNQVYDCEKLSGKPNAWLHVGEKFWGIPLGITVGEQFIMTGDNGIVTTPVQTIRQLEDEIIFTTKNSTYKLTRKGN